MCTVYVYVSFTSFRMWVCDWERKRGRKFVHVSTHACVCERDTEKENVYVASWLVLHARNCVCVHIWVAYTSYHFVISWHHSWQHLWGIFREVYHLWMFLFDTLYLMKAVHCDIIFCFTFSCVCFRL